MLQAIFAQILTPLSFMGFIMKEFDETRINLQFSINLSNQIKEIDKRDINKKELDFKGGSIEFKNVNFNYSNDDKEENKEILTNMNCVFEKGTKNAVVGYSGNGKSTIFNLIVIINFK